LAAGVACWGLLATGMAVADDLSHTKLQGDLEDVLSNVGAGEFVPVVIVLAERAPQDEIERLTNLADRADRRAEVIGLLKSVARRSQEDLLAALEDWRAAGLVGERVTPLWIANVIAAEVTPDVAYAIAERTDVSYISHDRPLGPEVFPVEPEQGDEPAATAIECGVDLMQAPRVWNELNITGRNVVVGVIDTGCCITHPDLANQIWVNVDEIPNNGVDDDGNGKIDDINGWNFQLETNDISDQNSHGTHVSGTVAGDGTNGQTTGMAPDALVMSLEFWNSFSGQASVWNAMQYAAENDAHATTASLGWPYSTNPDRRTWREVSENTMAAGVVVIFAAGNEGGGNPPNNLRTPGDVPDMITIGATDCNDSIAGFSSRGPVTWQSIDPWRDWPYPPGKMKPTVSAPGVNTLSTSNNCSGYSTKSGTSMATPHVAGAVALILEANPNLDHWDVKQLLQDTSVDLGANGRDNDFGAGRVNAFAAVEAAMQMNDRILPNNLEVTRGALIEGGLRDLYNSDDQYVVVEQRRPDEVAAASLEIVVTGTASTASPAEVEFTVESSTDGTPTRMRVELYNYNSASWEQVDERDGPMNDTPVVISVTQNPSRFVNGGDREVKARIGYHDRGVTFLNWSGQYDQVFWRTPE
jgi:serine protease AprX